MIVNFDRAFFFHEQDPFFIKKAGVFLGFV